MPYILSFVKSVEILDSDQYINDCCIGGDIVLQKVLPGLEARYEDIESNQEDWGWFAWFEHSRVKLAVDVYCNDAKTGDFQIHLTSRRPRFLLSDRVEDTPELEDLCKLMVSQLQAWDAASLRVERVNENYMPV